jgi:AraC-like DNA-binding protein
MDAQAGSRRLMVITPERVFYAGLLGRPKNRLSTGFHIYVAIEGGLSLTSGSGRQDDPDLVFARPNETHSLASPHPNVLCFVIEPETVAPGGLERLAARLSGETRRETAARFRVAHESLARRDSAARDSAALALLCLGEALPARTMDPRVVRAIARITAFDRAPASASDCAAAVGLSVSRFLHLFREQTGASFRVFRAAKRARHLLNFVSEDVNMARLAQDIGYPDSTHFSHSIRRFYGLKPRAILSGSRGLAVYRAPGPGLSSAARRAAGAT